MAPASSPSRSATELLDHNRRFYDLLWSGARLVEPERFNTWPLVRSLLAMPQDRLEVGPGLRPRLPIEATQFIDISAPALALLRERGARVVLGEVTALPFADASFDLLCALDVVEHVDDGDGALAELARVARSGATLLISAPLHPSRWSVFDEMVGHKRRYDPAPLLATLAAHGLVAERSAVYGMKPRSSRLVDLGMWWLANHRKLAMATYNRLFMPLGLRFQKELELAAGVIDMSDVDEILFVCRRTARPPATSTTTAASAPTFVNFAYGSNMSSRRLRARTPSARPIGIGQLAGHRLVWHMRGSDGSAKCDIVETGRPEDVVWGVLYEIAASEKALLDQAEGLGRAYGYKTVRVQHTAGHHVEAGAYVAIETDASLTPYDWYLGFVLAGADEHGLPGDYASVLKALATRVDPDEARRERNLAVLRDL
jgi:SAM-dependent methyltransferase